MQSSPNIVSNLSKCLKFTFAGFIKGFRLEILMVIIFLLVPSLGFADRVKLKNGDRITGQVIVEEEENITVITPYAGKILIKLSDVVSVETEQGTFAPSDLSKPEKKSSGWEGNLEFGSELIFKNWLAACRRKTSKVSNSVLKGKVSSILESICGQNHLSKTFEVCNFDFSDRLLERR